MTTSLICRSTFKRSLSDGNILSESNSPIENANIDKHEINKQMYYPDKIQGSSKVHSECTPEILSCESEASYTTRSALLYTGRLVASTHFCIII